jgi:hypothetical protein
MGLHIDPPAPWVTPEAFGPGGYIEEHTAYLLRTHGSRCLTMWQDDIAKYAAGRAITTSIIEQHARQSLDHWCMTRAAALVKADERHLLRKVEVRQKNRKEFRKTAAATGRASGMKGGR